MLRGLVTEVTIVAKKPDPSPQRIAELCDKIQEQWSAKDRTKRRVIAERRWYPPLVMLDAIQPKVRIAETRPTV